jgi:hypothetical protein
MSARSVAPFVLPLLASALLACGNESAGTPGSGGAGEIPDSGFDYALEFDGRDDYASTGTAAFPFPEDPQSVSLFVKRREQEGLRALVTLRKDRDSGLELGLRDGKPVTIRTYDGSAFVEAADPIPVGRWVHVAYTFDRTRHRLYVDGDLVGEQELAPNDRTPTTGWLGTLDGRQHLYDGLMDEVHVRNVLLSAEEVVREADGGAAGDAENVVAYFNFDEGAGARAYDRSGRANHASLGDGIPARAPSRVLSDR